MGRTKTVKKAAKLIIEKYYTRLTLDFHVNKRICEEIAIIPSKPLRNKIAGFVTHLMKRLQQTYLRGNCHHPQQTPQKQDRWFRHPFDEASSTNVSARKLPSSPANPSETRSLVSSPI